MRDLVIVGAGGHAREVLDIVEAINAQRPTWRFVGFLADDNPSDSDPLTARGHGVIGTTAAIEHIDAAYVVGIGAPLARERVDLVLRIHGREPVSLCHPSAIVASEVVMQPGCVVAANATLTTNIRMGRHVHVNVAASISHDCTLDDYTTLAPGVRLAGNVTTGRGVDIGIGAVVRPGIVIGDGATVGAGAAVVANVEASTVVAGVPAKPLSR